MALPLSQALSLSAEFFAAEPAAVSAVYEVQLDPSAPVEFAAIRRHPEAGSVLVSVERSEPAAQAALERASAVAAGDDLPLAYSGQVVGREVRIETAAGPLLVRIGGPALVGFDGASYPYEVLEPRVLRGQVARASASQLYDALRAADRAGRS
jgi:hypothetical protein